MLLAGEITLGTEKWSTGLAHTPGRSVAILTKLEAAECRAKSTSRPEPPNAASLNRKGRGEGKQASDDDVIRPNVKRRVQFSCKRMRESPGDSLL